MITQIKAQGIRLEDVYDSDVIDGDKTRLYYVHIKPKHMVCPYCSSKITIIKEYKEKELIRV